jgi:uncharacterized membrane protein YeaQ/YmgE (transglycosylase-associated protein family)
MDWLWLIVVGAVVGVLGRLLHPGREPMGFVVTIFIGILSLLVGGALFDGLWSYLVGVVVAVVAVTLYSRFTTRPAV